MNRYVVLFRSVVPRLSVVAVALVVVGLLGSLVTPFAGEATVMAVVADGRFPAVTTAAVFLTRLGDLWLVVVVAVAAAVIVRGSPLARRIHLVMLLAIGGSAVIVSALKVIVGRERPPGGLVPTLSAAYPSGHAVRAAVVCGLAAWAWHCTVGHRVWRAILVMATVLTTTGIAGSRIYLGVHLPSDVLAGVVIGGAWVVAVLHVALPTERSGAPEGR